jgi:hypothetical protein
VSAAKVDIHLAANGTPMYRVSSTTNSKKLFFTEAELADLARQIKVVLEARSHASAT